MKTTSQKIRTSFVVAAAIFFAVPLAAQAKGPQLEVIDLDSRWLVELQEPVYDGVKTTFTYRVTVNGDPELSHFDVALPDEADGVGADLGDPTAPGDYEGLSNDDWTKWDSPVKKGYSGDYSFVFEGDLTGVTGTCMVAVKAGQLFAVAQVPGPCDPVVEEEKGLDVEFSEPLLPLDELTPQICTDELKRQPLVAGQNIDVGYVCARVEDQDGNGDADTLVVTYETDNGWNLDETHLWVKNNEDPVLPANKKGNPKIGNFPYVSENVADTVKEVEIPLENFGDLHEMLCNGSGMALELNADLAAHASVVNDALGQETAWAAGEQITAKGSWAMKTELKFTCK
jgi:hypothetical protein